MACGTPAIVHNIGGAPEIVQQTGAGLVFDDFGKLPQLLDQLSLDSEYHRYSQAAFDGYRQHYTVDAHIQQYTQLLDRIVKERANS